MSGRIPRDSESQFLASPAQVSALQSTATMSVGGFLSFHFVQRLQSYLTPAFILRTVFPRACKYLAVLLLLINIRSFPLSWHFRVFRPVFALRFRYLWLRVKLFGKSRKEKAKAIDKLMEDLSPVGSDPFDRTVIYRAWAGPEDCDFNWHLSNSCYPKVLDGARFKAALDMFPNHFPVGGWMPLAATHHYFVREIPMFASYEVRMNIGSWDEKWMYVVCRFVTHPKKGSKGKHQSYKNDNSSMNGTIPVPSIHTVSTPSSLPSTPANPINADGKSHAPTASESLRVDATLRNLAEKQAHTPESDGATLHCVAVSQICFKHGRITVPPAIVLATNGFSLPPSEPSAHPYSRQNPPPFWREKILPLLELENRKQYREFLRGGWRQVPAGERWWEKALGGRIEERRKERLDVFAHLRMGMERAREL